MIQQGASGADAELEFRLVFSGVPTTGHVWATGELKLRLPGGSVVDATVANIVEKGNGGYALQLTSGETATTGKVYYWLDIATAGLLGADDEYRTEVIVPPAVDAAEIATEVDSTLTLAHGGGAWNGDVDTAEIATAVWTHLIESGYSAEQLLRALVSVLIGDYSDNDETNTRTHFALDGTTQRLSGIVSSDGRNVTIINLG